MSSSSVLGPIVERAARFLPAQGPISIFIHHNPLHAYEHEPFEQAIVTAARMLGCEPFLSEEDYRHELARGRITHQDVEAVLGQKPSAAGGSASGWPVTRFELRGRIVLYGVPEARGAPLAWLLEETAALHRFRRDLPADAREATVVAEGRRRGAEESSLVRALWRSCLAAVRRSDHTPLDRSAANALRAALARHRDLLLSAGASDVDDWVHPLLIRFSAAYLDQGLAHWPMSDRSLGMYRCFLATYGHPLARLSGSWARRLPQLIAEERSANRDAAASLHHSLEALGVEGVEWEGFLTEEALALRGWAGMVRQIEERPDRVPAFAVPARLVDFLAVRLLVTRAAVAHAARRDLRLDVPLDGVRAALRARLSPEPPPSAVERGWPIFHAAQLCGVDAAAVDALPGHEIAWLEGELAQLDALERRRILHLAYERHLRHRFYDAMTQHQPAAASSTPAFQVLFCIDEREESFRRHLEEIEPAVETFGAAGFFDVAMYYRGATDAHPRPLCPVAIHPEHYVTEVHAEGTAALERWRAARSRAAALVDKNIHIGSRTFLRGTVLMALLGVLWVIPLVVRVLMPWLHQRLSRRHQVGPLQTKLRLDRRAATPPIGRYLGFTVEEMADIVRRQLVACGVAERIAPLVFVLGHGSTSLNNPHESAHDCGACGGGRGGPNARAFAQMANDPRVRARLADTGLALPADTWFVGGQRNTASNAVILYDTEAIPAARRGLFERARRAFESARAREAHERCRRFDSAPTWISPRLALLHVEARSADLGQPRPEYGHATNAFCIVGRRCRTRGLFLDRRAFLVSYDPTTDTEGTVLSQLIAALVPVVAGINLEYLFGFLDPTGYGSGTKLPHNVTGLLGVMDGAQSDLRTGLPWQMLEVHEAVRLSLVVEARQEVLARVLQGDSTFRSLVENRWIFLACLDPESGALAEHGGQGWKAYAPEHPLRAVAGGSLSFYRGKRGYLPFVRLDGPAERQAGG